MHREGITEITEFEARIRAVTAKSIQAVAHKYFDPALLVVELVGIVDDVPHLVPQVADDGAAPDTEMATDGLAGPAVPVQRPDLLVSCQPPLPALVGVRDRQGEWIDSAGHGGPHFRRRTKR